MEIWRTQLATAREALAQAGLTAATCRRGHHQPARNHRGVEPPHRPARAPRHRLAGPPRRAHLRAAARAGLEETPSRPRPAWCWTPTSRAPSCKWMLDHVPGAREQAQRGELAFGTVDSWLLWQLTGGAVHATDVSNASRTMLLQRAHQPVGRRAAARCWTSRASCCRRCTRPATFRRHPAGPAGRTPSAMGGMAGDQQSALFGQACFHAGMAKNTYGTGCFMLMHTGSSSRPVATACSPPARAQPGQHPSLRWKAACLSAAPWCSGCATACAPSSSSEVQALAESVPDAGGVMFVPAFTGLGAPYWNPTHAAPSPA
jgi:glycerol kinase